jgi:hypothetical protein
MIKYTLDRHVPYVVARNGIATRVCRNTLDDSEVFASFNIKIHTLRLNSALYFTTVSTELCVLHR